MNKFFKVLSVSCLSLLMGMMMIVPATLPVSAQEGGGVDACTYWRNNNFPSEASCNKWLRESQRGFYPWDSALNSRVGKCLFVVGKSFGTGDVIAKLKNPKWLAYNLGLDFIVCMW